MPFLRGNIVPFVLAQNHCLGARLLGKMEKYLANFNQSASTQIYLGIYYAGLSSIDRESYQSS